MNAKISVFAICVEANNGSKLLIKSLEKRSLNPIVSFIFTS